jgi:capsular exopolysaccharide synthesis family protein
MERLDLDNIGNLDNFDIKAYIFKVLSYWKLFIISIIIALLVANYITKRKKKQYKLKSVITVKDEQNPLFSSTTNIMFNWGGASDEVETIITILGSRKHNEKVVTKLKYYIDYLQKGEYFFNDVYGLNNFKIKLDTNFYQLKNIPIKLDFKANNKVIVSVDFKDVKKLTAQNYTNFKTISLAKPNTFFKKEYDINNWITSDYFKFKIVNKSDGNHNNQTYYIRFNDYNQTVKKYQNLIIKNLKKGTSIISLEYIGTNKKRIVDFLNTTVDVLNHDQKHQKIQYAIKTKKYIDSFFNVAANSLTNIEKNLGDYKQRNKIYDLSIQGQSFFSQISELEKQAVEIKDRIFYYENLKKYINNTQELANIPAPAMVAMEDQTIPKYVNQLVALSKTKESLEINLNTDHPSLKNINQEINATKSVLQENLNTLKSTMQNKLASINKQLSKFKGKLSTLPKKEQGLIKYQRNYNITALNYEYLKQKQYEAGTAIAANISNIKILENAKDTGETPIYPKPLFNYLIALVLGLFLPLLYVIIKEFLDNKIHTVEDIENNYSIPVLGVIGKNTAKNNLAVFLKPKSTIAESFRAIRSNIQFLFKEKNKDNRTIVVTSSISGEGKTLCSINIATVFAMSNKKTILLGLDLRKPKIFDDFELTNKEGMTNYLIGQKTLEEVTIKTQIPNLDLILSGPTPPNPSELILNELTEELFKTLKEKYDYIIVDTPPIGLVADALELFKYSDANIYVIRQGYTQKGMPKMIDDKYKNGEVKNISYILNDFVVNNKYGYGNGYGYGYGYGYGNNAYGYHQNEEKKSFFKRLFNRK